LQLITSFAPYIGDQVDGTSVFIITTIMDISTIATLLFIIATEEDMGDFFIIMDSMLTVDPCGTVVCVGINLLAEDLVGMDVGWLHTTEMEEFMEMDIILIFQEEEVIEATEEIPLAIVAQETQETIIQEEGVTET
jgi:hypothetical protein